MLEQPLSIEVVTSLSAISPALWDSLACPEAIDGAHPIDPFTTYRFLKTLEDSGSVGSGTGWEPCYMLAYSGQETIGAAPMYVKSHSQGEYIFDHNWAHAYERAGGRYYPKLQIAVPFTPATGRRFLTKQGHHGTAMKTLVKGALDFGSKNKISSLHVTFCTKKEKEAAENMSLLGRVTQQFHWKNDGYTDFDGFLSNLSSRKRKNIRKERSTANNFGGTISVLTGADIKPEHWDAFWGFYQDTGARKWGRPYLSRAFFDIAQDVLRDDIALVLAERESRYIAGALNFIGKEGLYGRYWGCVEHHPCLHFELCYYRAIDFAITRGLKTVEAGAQGEHKLARGYLPRQTYSLHWLADEGFHNAVATYLREETKAVNQDIDIMTSYGPFRNANVEEHE